MTTVTSVASQKGGVGKSTTAISLAAGLTHKGRKVLLIDMDSQANSSKVLLPDYQVLTKDDTTHATILQQQLLPIRTTPVNNLWIVPSHILLSNTDVELTQSGDEHKEQRLKVMLDQVKHNFDNVIIDCPPALGWLTINAFTASDEIVIVISPGYFELDSIVQISKTIGETIKYFNFSLKLRGLLFTMSDPTVNTATSLAILRKNYGELLLRTIIPRNTDLRDAHFNKQDIFRYNPAAKGAIAYARLIEELYP